MLKNLAVLGLLLRLLRFVKFVKNTMKVVADKSMSHRELEILPQLSIF